MIGMKANDPAAFVCEHEGVSKGAQRLGRLPDGETMAVAPEQFHHARRRAAQVFWIMQDDAQATVASSGKEGADRLRPLSTFEVQILQVRIEDADFLVRC